MRRRLAGAAICLAIALGVACSSSDTAPANGVDDAGGGQEGSTTTGDGALADGATDDAHDADVEDALVDAGDEDSSVVVPPGVFTLTSNAFVNNAAIPAAHACNANASPPLAWTDAPAGTLSYAVVVRDLSLIAQPNYHWVIYDIPAADTSLAQGVQNVAEPAVPAGAKQTYWSFGASYSYLGPCPPVGTNHTYEFTVYSFATATIPVPAGTTSPAVADTVIQAEKTGMAKLSGTYMR